MNIKAKTLQRNFTCCPSMSFISPHLSNIGLFLRCREGCFNGIETLLEPTYLKRGFRIQVSGLPPFTDKILDILTQLGG